MRYGRMDGGAEPGHIYLVFKSQEKKDRKEQKLKIPGKDYVSPK
jgi:hypothetical protein